MAQFLSPWPSCGSDCYKDSFNYGLSHSCQCVKQAFGMLMQSWEIFSFSWWSSVVLACMKLHILCLDRNVDIPNRQCVNENMMGTF